MTNPIFLQTIGLEIEVTDINVNNLRLPHNWRVTNDASVESDVLTLNGIPIINNTNIHTLNLDNQLQGGELLSSIIDTHSNYVQELKILCNSLITKGEPDRSERAGLHVHLSFTNPNLIVLKNIIKLGCHLEDVFFLLGGMGYEFRGLKNDCSYCRPITTPGPQVIDDDNGRLYPCFTTDDLLEAKTINDFKIRLGDYLHLGESKYIPIRYHWLNLWNIWNNKETLEFRVFNHSLKPRYIETVIEVSKAFGNAVMYYNYHLEELDELECNSVYSHRSKSEILETFLKFATPHLEPRIIDLALRIMTTTPIESIRLPKIPFYFHLRFHRSGSRSPIHWGATNYRPSLSYDRKDVAEPYFEDIHNLRSQRRNQNSEPILDMSNVTELNGEPSWYAEDGSPSSGDNEIEVTEIGGGTYTQVIADSPPVASPSADPDLANVVRDNYDVFMSQLDIDIGESLDTPEEEDEE